jgi:hypothetical protein
MAAGGDALLCRHTAKRFAEGRATPRRQVCFSELELADWHKITVPVVDCKTVIHHGELKLCLRVRSSLQTWPADHFGCYFFDIAKPESFVVKSLPTCRLPNRRTVPLAEPPSNSQA